LRERRHEQGEEQRERERNPQVDTPHPVWSLMWGSIPGA